MKTGLVLEYTHVMTNSYYSDEKFGEWSESAEFHGIISASICRPRGFPDVVCNTKLKSGDICHIVYVVYSQGDSFGMGDRTGLEFVYAFVEESEAKELVEHIEKTECSNYIHQFTTSSGQSIEYPAPWIGYFESIDEVGYSTVVIK